MLKRKKLLFSILGTLLIMIPCIAFGASETKGLREILEGLKDQITSVAEILVVVSYVAGVGFALAGIIQFKAHKDNPAQMPLSKPIVYIVVGACLLFLPQILKTAGTTVFGEEESDPMSFTVGG